MLLHVLCYGKCISRKTQHAIIVNSMARSPNVTFITRLRRGVVTLRRVTHGQKVATILASKRLSVIYENI